MARAALVTGATGFVGQWLCRGLLEQGWDVTAGVRGFDAAAGGASEAATLTTDERDAVRWVPLDTRSDAELGAALDVARPDAVFHLAGISAVPAALADPGAACEANISGAARLLAAVRTRRRSGMIDPAVLVVGSGEQYGRHDEIAMPLPEDAELRPLTVYAATKIAQEVVAMEAFRSEGVRVLATRSFNHSGPGQLGPFLIPQLVRRVLKLRAEPGDGRLIIGNRHTVRDFLHVADVVRAYILLVERGTAGEAYNVCSGVGQRVVDLAHRVLAALDVTAEVVTVDALARAVEVPTLVGDNRKVRAATGWAPARSIDDIISDLIYAETH